MLSWEIAARMRKDTGRLHYTKLHRAHLYGLDDRELSWVYVYVGMFERLPEHGIRPIFTIARHCEGPSVHCAFLFAGREISLQMLFANDSDE